MDNWWVAVDAGGTHTRAAAWSPGVGGMRRGDAAGANWTVNGPDTCRERITQAIAAAIPADGTPVGLAICMAGYYPPEHAEAVDSWMAAAWPRIPGRLATTDLVAAWAGAHGGEPGLVMIGGTGSVCYGRLAGGREARAGGWGPLYNDQGSGYAVGLSCLRALADQADGIMPITGLAARVMETHPHEDRGPTTDLRIWLRGIYRCKWDRERIAGLSREVVAAAAAGDPAAEAILDGAGRDLASLALAVERSLGVAGLPIAFQGSFVTCTPGLEIERRLREAGSSLQVKPALYTPLAGALLLAAEVSGGAAVVRSMREDWGE